MLPVADVYSTLVFADHKKLFADLGAIYQELPESSCGDCDSCCSIPPSASFVEYLAVYRYLRDNLSEKLADVVRRSAEYFFLESVVPELKCPFCEPEGCLIAPVRPLGCRLFGVLSRADYEEGESRRVSHLRALVDHFHDDCGIQLPSEVLVLRSYCEKASNEGKELVTAMQADEYKMRLLTLDASIVTPELVYRERTYLPLPVHLAMTALNAGVRGKRLDVIRSFLSGSREILDKYVDRTKNFRY